MDARVHIVKAGETPQILEKLYSATWQEIRECPGNVFLKQRKGYPLHPGDRVHIPNRPAAKPTEAPGFTQPFEEFLALVNANMKLLLALTNQHPARSSVRVYSTALPNKHPGVSATKAADVVGYKKSLPKVRSSVVLTEPIESAFTVLSDTLPVGAVMTSGYRSDADQARVINDYFAKFNGPGAISEVEARRQWLLALKDENGKSKGLKIAAVGCSPHRTGLAFDLSGASLDAIERAVTQCAQTYPDKFPLLNTILERNQNCLHVNLKH
ncbi:MAG TPA: hypothetical protein VFQ61_02465 [Polyangiaceae bacterium]|nr:hypothetical protein [Polyangiaceae bacterium]